MTITFYWSPAIIVPMIALILAIIIKTVLEYIP
jgi:hypothetical protein